MPGLITVLAIVALVLLIAALFSGLVDRTPLTFPMIFLTLGFLVGDYGLKVIHITPHDPTLENIATLSLAFVLFLDGLNLRFREMGREWIVPVLTLGPGTLLTALIISAVAALILHLPILQALLLGSILSSVDPVLLRDIVRDERLPRSIRQSLKTEAGTNDIIVLPTLLILAAVTTGKAGSPETWGLLLLQLFILGPLGGVLVGTITVFLMNQVRKRTRVSREYRALYGVGSLLAAYIAGEGLGGSGFIAVFVAGFVVVSLDYDLCDCFLDYAEITSEMLMLLAFLLFGSMLSNVIGTVPLIPALLVAVIVIVVARPVAIQLVLHNAPVSRAARLFIGWFGPRGLSSLLFGLLLVTKGVPGANTLLAFTGIVVIISVFAHGISSSPFAILYNRSIMKHTLPEEREASAAGLFRHNPAEVPRITIQELANMLGSEHPPIVLDVRSRSTYDLDSGKIPSSIRVLPDGVREWAANQDRERNIITYCT